MNIFYDLAEPGDFDCWMFSGFFNDLDLFNGDPEDPNVHLDGLKDGLAYFARGAGMCEEWTPERKGSPQIPPEGAHMATLQFKTLAPTSNIIIDFTGTVGKYSQTRVFDAVVGGLDILNQAINPTVTIYERGQTPKPDRGNKTTGSFFKGNTPTEQDSGHPEANAQAAGGCNHASGSFTFELLGGLLIFSWLMVVRKTKKVHIP